MAKKKSKAEDKDLVVEDETSQVTTGEASGGEDETSQVTTGEKPENDGETAPKVEKKIYVAEGKALVAKVGILKPGDEIKDGYLEDEVVENLLKTGHLVEK